MAVGTGVLGAHRLLGHAPVSRVCTQQATSAPAGAAGAASAAAVSLGQDAPDISLNACLCLAVLFTLLLLGMAAGPGRPAFRLPARVGWALTLPPRGVVAPVSRHSLQVLRL